MAYSYQVFEDDLEPMPNIEAWDPYGARSSGAYPEGFPLSPEFNGLIIDDNIPKYNIYAQRPMETGLSIRQGRSLGAVSDNTLLLAGAAILGYFLFFKKKK